MSEDNAGPVISFRPEGFVSFLNILKDSYGSAGESMIYNMSWNYGKQLIESFMKEIPQDDHESVEESVKLNLETVRNLGWGTFNVTSFDMVKGEVEVQLENLVFSGMCTDPGRMSQCYFIRGVLSGTLSTITGRDLYVREYECRGGETKNCFFKLSAQPRVLESSNKEIRKLHDIVDAVSVQRLHQDRLEAMYQLTQMMDRSEQEILDFALDEGVKNTESKIGYIKLMSEDQTTLTLHAWSGDVMDQCKMTTKQTEYKLVDTGLWGEAARQGKPIITNDYEAPNPLKRGYPDGHVPIERHMNVPIFDGDRIVMIVGVANKEDDYDETDAQTLVVLNDVAWKSIQKKRAEDALRLSEASLAEAQRIAGLGNWDWDIVTNELLWSDEIFRIFGWEPQAFGATYETFIGFVHPDDKGLVTTAVDEALVNNSYSIDHRIVLPSGEVRYVHEQAEVAYDDSGTPVRMIGTVQDITELKQLEEERKKIVYQLNNVEAGGCYLSDSYERCFKTYSYLRKFDVPGLCIVRDDPQKIAREYDLTPEEVRILSSKSIKGFEAISDLQALSLSISDTIKAGESVVLLNGLEYLIASNGFDRVFNFLQEKRFQFLETESILLLPFSMETVNEREGALLRSELRIM